MLSQIMYSRDLDEVVGKTLGDLTEEQGFNINLGFDPYFKPGELTDDELDQYKKDYEIDYSKLTANVSELKEWKVLTHYTERTDDSQDALYGGFTYAIFANDDNLVLAFRGSVGTVAKDPLKNPTCSWAEYNHDVKDCKGDWHNNFHVYPYTNDPGGNASETVIDMLSEANIDNLNLYITGHSRGGMLAQRAGAQVTLYDDLEEQLVEVAYFNGPGVVFSPFKIASNTPITPQDINIPIVIYTRLLTISKKVTRHIVCDNEGVIGVDLTSQLGWHLLLDIKIYQQYMQTEGESITGYLHSMYHFINRLKMYERG